MAQECCYSCLNFEDGLCSVSDRHDDENPNLFKCDLYDEDVEETRLV